MLRETAVVVKSKPIYFYFLSEICKMELESLATSNKASWWWLSCIHSTLVSFAECHRRRNSLTVENYQWSEEKQEGRWIDMILSLGGSFPLQIHNELKSESKMKKEPFITIHYASTLYSNYLYCTIFFHFLATTERHICNYCVVFDKEGSIIFDGVGCHHHCRLGQILFHFCLVAD